jgi:phytoene synthase
MIAGQRMDLYRSRYESFDELNLYCYRVAGTVGLMSVGVIGLQAHSDRLQAPWADPTLNQENWREHAIALGVAKQLTNILRDVGEDARRGRIYIPLEDLALFDYTPEDLFQGVVDERWKGLMQFQIQRARKFYAQAESAIQLLSQDARWPVWSALILYRQILDVIERNQYNVFTQRAFVSASRKFFCLPLAWLKSL